MSDLADIIAYTISKYPETLGHELSTARLTKMIYLADWHSCLHRGKQITSIRWFFDNHGPFVWDVKEAAENRPDLFEIKYVPNIYGSTKRQFQLKNRNYKPSLTPEEKKSIDYIIDVTKKLYWAEFIKLVYSTHPITSSERHTFLDLKHAAKEYQSDTQAI